MRSGIRTSRQSQYSMTRHGRSGKLVKLVKLHRMIGEKAIYSLYDSDLIIIFNISCDRLSLPLLNLAFLSASFELILVFFFFFTFTLSCPLESKKFTNSSVKERWNLSLINTYSRCAFFLSFFLSFLKRLETSAKKKVTRGKEINEIEERKKRWCKSRSFLKFQVLGGEYPKIFCIILN